MKDLSDSSIAVCRLIQDQNLDIEEAIFVLSSVIAALIHINVEEESQGAAYWAAIKNLTTNPTEVIYDA